MLNRADHIVGPFASEDEAHAVSDVVVTTFVSEAERVGSGSRWWVVIAWGGGKKDAEWVSKFGAYVAGYLEAWRKARC